MYLDYAKFIRKKVEYVDLLGCIDASPYLYTLKTEVSSNGGLEICPYPALLLHVGSYLRYARTTPYSPKRIHSHLGSLYVGLSSMSSFPQVLRIRPVGGRYEPTRT